MVQLIQGEVSEKDGNLQTYSSFHVPTGMAENRCTICELPLDPVRLGAFPAFHCRFFKMAASASWQCTVCEAVILQSTSEFLNHDCTGTLITVTSFGSQLVLFCSVEQPKISSCGCKNCSIIKLSTIEPAKFI